ncbi:MAG: hypothetical protein KDI05_10340 [Halieaceae bacterium]|nr:hypothetical protein [Halieaceae bacterium]MCP5163895.1 hypothetical protein [Pseudomonadales bacterium]MCP5202945.1 hypothetical protein [Pseudomonadales bacterium]
MTITVATNPRGDTAGKSSFIPEFIKAKIVDRDAYAAIAGAAPYAVRLYRNTGPTD